MKNFQIIGKYCTLQIFLDHSLFFGYHANGSHVGKVFSVFVWLSVFPCDISTTNAARTIELDTNIFHYMSWKPIYLRDKRSKIKVTRHKTMPAWVPVLLWVLASC